MRQRGGPRATSTASVGAGRLSVDGAAAGRVDVIDVLPFCSDLGVVTLLAVSGWNLANSQVRRQRRAPLHAAYDKHSARLRHRQPEPPQLPAAA